jgi:hypothetical protein
MELNFAMMILRERRFRMVQMKLILNQEGLLGDIKYENSVYFENKMSNLYRRPSKDASYQVSVYLAEGLQRRRLQCEKLFDDRQQMPDAK